MGYLNADKKQELFATYGKSNTDTGSPESQVALFSYRINHLTEHLKKKTSVRSARCCVWSENAVSFLII